MTAQSGLGFSGIVAIQIPDDGATGEVLTKLSPDNYDYDWAVGGGGGGAPVGAEYVVMSLDATLTDERVLTAGTGINIVDGGAGGAVTISANAGGATLSAEYRFDTSIVEADPGNGDFRMDNATPASVTELFISSTTDNGNDFDNILGFISAGDQIYIQQDNDATKFILLDVTANVDNTGWYSIAGTVSFSGTIFDGNARCTILILFGGTSPAGDVFKVGTPVAEEFAIWTGDGTLASEPDFTYDGVSMVLRGLIVQVTQFFRSRGLDDRATARRLLVFNNVSQWGPADDDEYSFSRVLDTGSMGAAGGSGKTGGGNFIFRGDAHTLFPGDFTMRSGLGVWLNWDESAGITTFSTGIGNPKTLALTIDASQDAAFEGNVDISGDLEIIETVPTVFWNETNAPVDNRLWAMAADVGQFYIQLFNDARSAAAKVFTIDRTLNVADLFTFFGDASFTEDVTVVGSVDIGIEALFTERADHSFTPIATRGILWVRDDVPNVLIYTDDAGTDFVLNGAGGGDVFKVGTPVDNQIGVWTGDGTIEGTAGLTYDGVTFNVTGDITLTGTVDGIDIATDVAANTAKVTNQTHTGQVTGAIALALDVTAITDQPASGAIVAADTIIINDGGVLSEATFTQMITFFDANLGFGDVFKVGTPVDNQIGVWTGDGTIEGDADFLWDDSAGATDALQITAPVGLAGGFLVDIDSNQAGKTGAVTRIIQNHFSASADALLIQQNSNASGAVIFEATHTATSSAAYAARIRTAGIHSGAVLRLHHDNPASTGHGLTIKVDGPGDAINIELGEIVTTAGMQLDTDVVFTEQADHTFTPVATRGIVWVRDDAPNVLIFTDDAGTDFVLNGGGGGDTKRYIQVSGSGAAQVITGTPITMDLSVSDITTGAGDFTLAADVVTVVNAGTYRISAQCTVADTDTGGSARTTVELAVEVNSSPVAGSVTRDYHRETEDSTGVVNFFVTLSASDAIRVRLDRLGAATNIETVPTLCKLNIELIS